jgi:hypothetical protein
MLPPTVKRLFDAAVARVRTADARRHVYTQHACELATVSAIVQTLSALLQDQLAGHGRITSAALEQMCRAMIDAAYLSGSQSDPKQAA